MNLRQIGARFGRAYGHWLAFLCCFLMAGTSQAEEQPTAAMMEPVHGLVTFMSSLRRGEQPTVFARRGLCIVENFAPFLFCGLEAAANWSVGFRAHAAAGDLKNLDAGWRILGYGWGVAAYSETPR